MTVDIHSLITAIGSAKHAQHSLTVYIMKQNSSNSTPPLPFRSTMWIKMLNSCSGTYSAVQHKECSHSITETRV